MDALAGQRSHPETATVPALLGLRVKATPSEPAHWSLAPDGRWESTSWADFAEEAGRIAAGLRRLGLRPGDRLGILATTSRQWDVVQMGAFGARAVVVGLDSQETGDRLGEAMRQSGVSILVADSFATLEKVDPGVRRAMKCTIVLDREFTGSGSIVPISALLMETTADPRNWSEALPDDPATIVFTSGSTGHPKGVMYTHRQVCLAVASIAEAFPDVGSTSRLACWLPLANLFQRMVNFWAIRCGAGTYYVGDPREIMQHLPTIAPDIFIAVPRFYEKFYAGIRESLGKAPLAIRALAGWALRQGRSRAEAVEAGLPPQLSLRVAHFLADRLFLRRLRRIVGTNLRFFVSGSAPMPPWLLKEYAAMGWLVLEAYGTSENIVPIAANRPGAWKLGTVGTPMSGNEVRLAEDGEVLVRGQGLCSGYYGVDEAGVAVHPDGFLATGDLGTMDADGYLTLVGRKSEVFKTSTGRRIAPAAVEQQIARTPGVEHAVVVGAGRKSPVAILALAPSLTLARDEGSPDLDGAWASVRDAIGFATAGLADYQKPAGFVLTARPFSPESGELTTNLKLRRAVIERHYAASLSALYKLVDTRATAGTTLRVAMDELIAVA